MLIDIDDYLLGTRDQNGKYNFTSKYGLILKIKDQVNFGCNVSVLLDCHRRQYDTCTETDTCCTDRNQTFNKNEKRNNRQ